MSDAMSDDDDVIVVPSGKSQKVVHYGSLEETERARLAAASAGDSPKPTANISTSSGRDWRRLLCGDDRRRLLCG